MWNLHVVLKVTRRKLSFSGSEGDCCLFVEWQSLERCCVICFFHFNSEKVSFGVTFAFKISQSLLCRVRWKHGGLHHSVKFLLCSTLYARMI